MEKACNLLRSGKEKKRKEMACYVPFNNKNLDVSFFIFRPTVVCLDHLLLSLKQFSVYTHTHLGSVHSSIFTSIHGSMIVWYGAWIKKSNENKQLLISALLSVLRNVESMAILMEYSFFDAFAGESRDGSPAAKFFTGDIVTLSSATNSSQNNNASSYACLAIFKDQFLKMEGARSGVCFQSQTLPRTAAIVVWKSLQFCYTYILTSDYRNKVLPYFDDFAVDLKYDVFRVVYVSGQDHSALINTQFCPMDGNGVDNNQVSCPVLQDSKER